MTPARPQGVRGHLVKFQLWLNCPFNCVGLPMLGVLSENRFPYMLFASKKAPSSRTSSSMVAVWACSVLFMSCHDCRASGRSRLSTVCTTAWAQKNAGWSRFAVAYGRVNVRRTTHQRRATKQGCLNENKSFISLANICE